jgi:hypothetical protein
MSGTGCAAVCFLTALAVPLFGQTANTINGTANEAPPQTDEVYFPRGVTFAHNRRDGSGRRWRTASSSRQ